MQEYIRYMQSLWVWDWYPDKKSLPSGLDKIVGHRWVLVNKGDSSRPLIRARLVATEVKHDKGVGGNDPMLFSATPPLEALRILLSLAAANPNHVVGQIDVRKAHLHGLSTRRIAVQLPSQAGSGFGFLRRTLYGTRRCVGVGNRNCTRLVHLWFNTRQIFSLCVAL